MKRRDLMAAAMALPVASHAAAWLEQPYSDGMRLTGPGHNLLAILAAALKLPGKTEFETQDAHADRLLPLLKKPVYGSVTLADRLAFRAPLPRYRRGEMPVGWSYDPSAQQMELECDQKSRRYDPITTLDFAILHSGRDLKITGTYTGQTAYGRSTKVTTTDVTQWELLGGLPYGFWDGNTPKEALDAQNAADQLPQAVLWVTGAMEPPYVTVENGRLKPTISDPFDQKISTLGLVLRVQELFVATKTGAVIARREMPKD